MADFRGGEPDVRAAFEAVHRIAERLGHVAALVEERVSYRAFMEQSTAETRRHTERAEALRVQLSDSMTEALTRVEAQFERRLDATARSLVAELTTIVADKVEHALVAASEREMRAEAHVKRAVTTAALGGGTGIIVGIGSVIAHLLGFSF